MSPSITSSRPLWKFLLQKPCRWTILSIQDAYFRYYTVIRLNKKSAAANEFIKWVTKREIFFCQQGEAIKVAAVRTDNGSQFVNSTLHEFFRRRGIEHQMTIPYTSFQNGAVERAHRTIEERTRCLLFGGRVPTTLWTEAVSCAVYLINRLPVSTRSAWEYPLLSLVQCTPISEFSLDHLRVFGCAVT